MSVIEHQTTDLEQSIAGIVRELPIEKKREVLDFAQFLESKLMPRPPRLLIEGAWSDLPIDKEGLDKAIDEVRREMWHGFPREDEW